MLTIHVCIGSACHLKGSYNVINKLQKLINDSGVSDKIDVKAAFCLGHCTQAVSMRINDEEVFSASEKTIETLFKEKILPRI